MIHAVLRSIFENGASNAHCFQDVLGNAFLRQHKRRSTMLDLRDGKRVTIAPFLLPTLIQANKACLSHMQAGKRHPS